MFFPAAVAAVLLFFFSKNKNRERGWSQFPVESKTLLVHPVPRYLSDWTVCARLLYTQVDIISSLLSGRLVREKVGPAVQSAVQSQVGSHSTSSPKRTKGYDAMRFCQPESYSRPLLPSCAKMYGRHLYLTVTNKQYCALSYAPSLITSETLSKLPSST